MKGKRHIAKGAIDWSLIDKLLRTTDLPTAVIAIRANVATHTVNQRMHKIGLKISYIDHFCEITVREPVLAQ